ncbi:hypothetical protein H072_1538 [Dactylellina haptotyla CBS 200.50]|uniref:Uncharacterized protein n=1 Tax=Dactylellina haptotyla (strain CBS 200.50) TaxID=1284197 RepID=S8ANM0_DACHA|nr:hypothetical protein H072_1538 [Dactylellina haptotyla CBS 200.50]
MPPIPVELPKRFATSRWTCGDIFVGDQPMPEYRLPNTLDYSHTRRYVGLDNLPNIVIYIHIDIDNSLMDATAFDVDVYFGSPHGPCAESRIVSKKHNTNQYNKSMLSVMYQVNSLKMQNAQAMTQNPKPDKDAFYEIVVLFKKRDSLKTKAMDVGYEEDMRLRFLCGPRHRLREMGASYHSGGRPERELRWTRTIKDQATVSQPEQSVSLDEDPPEYSESTAGSSVGARSSRFYSKNRSEKQSDLPDPMIGDKGGFSNCYTEEVCG